MKNFSVGVNALFQLAGELAAMLGSEFDLEMVDGKPKTLLVHRKGSTRAFGPHHPDPAVANLFKPHGRPPPARPPPANPRLHYAACWAGDHDRDACEAAARARDAEAFKGGMTVKEINAAFGERAGELKKPAKRVGLIDMGLIHLFMM